MVPVTRDGHGLEHGVARGLPPRGVCLAIGHADSASLLRQQAETVEPVGFHQQAGFPLLRPSPSSA
ncbi:MAG: hypothetical protein ACKO0M_03130 [Cyanobium sp.]